MANASYIEPSIGTPDLPSVPCDALTTGKPALVTLSPEASRDYHAPSGALGFE